MPHDIHAFIFDLDGTLLDSLEDIADAANAALAAERHPTWPADLYRNFIGNGMAMLMRRAAPPDASDIEIVALHEVMRRNYASNWRNKTLPYEGVPQMLNGLAETPFPLAVLSNKPHNFTDVMTRYFFPDIPFVRVQGKPDGGKGKPDPSLALSIADELGVPPDRTAFVGDSGVDMDTAAAAGMIAVGVLWGFRSREELLARGACVLLQNPSDIFDYL